MSSFQDIIYNLNTSMSEGSNILETLQNVINSNPGPRTDGKWTPYVDIVESQTNTYLYIDIPGVSQDSINIDFTNNKLIVSGEKIKKYETQNIKKIKNEIIYGKFIRNITLPMNVSKKENVSVKYIDGVLCLDIDKQKEQKNSFSINITK